jgi:hypothetical protein
MTRKDYNTPITKLTAKIHHHHDVQEGLGVFPVP